MRTRVTGHGLSHAGHIFERDVVVAVGTQRVRNTVRAAGAEENEFEAVEGTLLFGGGRKESVVQ